MAQNKNKLFRKEAIEFKTKGIIGDILLIHPTSYWKLTVVFLFIVITTISYLYFAKYTRRVTVTGYLASNSGVAKVFAAQRGIISKRYIFDGQNIEKGQDLYEVRTERNIHNNSTVNSLLIEQFKVRKKELTNRINDEKTIFNNENEYLLFAKEGISNELLKINQQEQTQKERFELAEDQLNKYISFREQNLVTEDELNLYKNRFLDSKYELSALELQKIKKETELSNVLKLLKQLPLNNKNTIQDISDELKQLEERTILLKGDQLYVIKSPINGVITSLQGKIGETVSDNAFLLSIIPEDITLHAELFVPSRAIGFIKKGDKVLLRYDAFPHQRFGLYKGTIDMVAKSVINPDESNSILTVNEPIYIVKVTINSQSITAYGETLSLQPGMSISADILLDERSLGEWLLAPIYNLRGRI